MRDLVQPDNKFLIITVLREKLEGNIQILQDLILQDVFNTTPQWALFLCDFFSLGGTQSLMFINVLLSVLADVFQVRSSPHSMFYVQ